MNDFVNNAASQGATTHPVVSSLAISNNLDAMLEHDESTHRTPHPLDNARFPPLFQPSRSPTFSTGLPPPPRGNRKVGSPTLRAPDSVGSRSTLWSDATESSFPSLGPSNPFINAVPKLTPNGGPSGQNQSPSCPTPISLTATRIPDSPWMSLEHVVDSPSVPKPVHGRDMIRPTDRDHNSPSIGTHALPRTEEVIDKGKSILPLSSLQPRNSSLANPTEDGRATVAGGLLKLPHWSDSSTTMYLVNERSTQKEGDETSTTPPLTALSRSADVPKMPPQAVLSHSRRGSWSRRRSHSYSSESKRHPTTVPMPMLQPISISNTVYPSSSYLDSQQRQVSGSPDPMSALNDFDEYHLSSTSTSPSSIEFATSTQDHSPTSPIPRASRPSLYTHRRSRAPYSNRSPISPSLSSRAAVSATPSCPKPPLPTSPKPTYGRSASANPPSTNTLRGPSPNRSPKAGERNLSPMPPTTNFLDAQERAELVKKSRKLMQMFGTTPGASVLAQKYDELQPSSLALPALLPVKPGKCPDVLGAPLMPGMFRPSLDDKELKSSWVILGGNQASGRRHSVPSSPDDISILRDDVTEEHSQVIKAGDGDLSSNEASSRQDLGLRTSFMNMSYESISNDGASAILSAQTPNQWSRQYSPSPRTPTIAEQEEADRKRKRDQLAKLHRFLGSRVPVGLVLGLDAGDAPLPPLALQAPDCPSKSDKFAEPRKAWLTRRRSSSSAVYPMTSHDLDRLNENLSDEEKAINVRRAQKMEKVFGVLPPQVLYHTRCSPSPTHRPASPASPAFGRWTAPPSPISRSRDESQLFERNPNQSPHKSKAKKPYRPGTPESVQHLLPNRSSVSFNFEPESMDISDVYTHYQHSLHSLNDIINREDTASLAELHCFLRGEVPDPALQEYADHSGFVSGSLQSERRRSLPLPVLSTVESSVPMPKPEATDFQLRRRRAAKLTQFFGVDYNQIIHDVLESIEKGVEEERKKGTLQPEEVEVLLRKVHTLKTKRSISL